MVSLSNFFTLPTPTLGRTLARVNEKTFRRAPPQNSVAFSSFGTLTFTIASKNRP
jgi:hypothetical protein